MNQFWHKKANKNETQLKINPSDSKQILWSWKMWLILIAHLVLAAPKHYETLCGFYIDSDDLARWPVFPSKNYILSCWQLYYYLYFLWSLKVVFFFKYTVNCKSVSYVP